MSEFKHQPNFTLILITILITVLTSVQSGFLTAEDYEAEVIATIPTPRGLYLDPAGEILVLARGLSSVLALYQKPDSDTWTQTQLVNGSGLQLNHGLSYNTGWLYASNGSSVFRWPYEPGQRSPVAASEEIVIYNISVPDANKVNTRTLIFDDEGQLYVTINSDIRLDPTDSWRCRIRRFNLDDFQAGTPIDFETGELIADGVRNEVGLAFDSDGVLWGVENAGGADYLIRDELDPFPYLHDGNPGEELNRFDKPPGTHYGYPFCWGSYNLSGHEVGTQFAWPPAADGIHTDEWCRNPSNNEKAAFYMPAHMAPLGLEFYKDGYNACSSDLIEAEGQGGFPCTAKGSAIIAYHGSSNITIPVGYKVSMYSFDSESHLPTGHEIDLLWDDSQTGHRSFRPVNAIFNQLGQLIVSADTSNQIMRVMYKPKEIGESTTESGVGRSTMNFGGMWLLNMLLGLCLHPRV